VFSVFQSVSQNNYLLSTTVVHTVKFQIGLNTDSVPPRVTWL